MRNKSLTLLEAKKYLAANQPGKYIEGLDLALGFFTVLAPVALGPAFLPLLALLGPKNELIRVMKATVTRVTKKADEPYFERYQRMQIAHLLVVYQAAAEALTHASRELAALLPDQSSAALSLSLPSSTVAGGASNVGAPPPGTRWAPVGAQGDGAANLTEMPIPMPHPVVVQQEDTADPAIKVLEVACDSFCSAIRTSQEYASLQSVEAVEDVLSSITDLARQSYVGLYVDLCRKYEEFYLWRQIVAFEEVRATQQGVRYLLDHLETTDVDRQIDQGFRQLHELVEQRPSRMKQAELSDTVRDMLNRARNDVELPVVSDAVDPSDPSVASLRFPTRAEAFVPQAGKAVRYEGRASLPLEFESSWSKVPEIQDLGRFLYRYFLSGYSLETPLLILGHPGSGKSLLTRILAAQISTPEMAAVRIELRDVDPSLDIQSLIQRAIFKVSGRDSNWVELYPAFGGPPLVIFDGFDELLQVTGEAHRTFLRRIADLQERELSLGRPFRALVTSRLSLIDRADTPIGSTVLRLSQFDEPRQNKWISKWNEVNSSYFKTTGNQPFSLEGTGEDIQNLATQPLLLLMLALFDSDGGALSRLGDLDRTQLYENLLHRFVEREHLKVGDTPDPKGLAASVEGDLDKLSILAIAMFNRRSLSLSRRELGSDLLFFGSSGAAGTAGPGKLTDAELVLGSFFFVHEATDDLAGPEAFEHSRFEFLHNTFGEFLVARFMVKTAVANAEKFHAMLGNALLTSSLADAVRHANYFDRGWYGCFAVSALHERPVIADMASAWCRHAVARSDLTVEAFDVAIKNFVRMESCALIMGVCRPMNLDFTPPENFPHVGLARRTSTYLANILVLLANMSATHPSSLGDELSVDAWIGIEVPKPSVYWSRWLGLIKSSFSSDELAGLVNSVHVDQSDETFQVAPTGEKGVISNQYIEASVGSGLSDHKIAVVWGQLAMADWLSPRVEPQRLLKHLKESDASFVDVMWQSQVLRLAPALVSMSDREVLREMTDGGGTFNWALRDEPRVWFRHSFMRFDELKSAYTERRGPEHDAAIQWATGSLSPLHPQLIVEGTPPLQELIVPCRSGPKILPLMRPPSWLLAGASGLEQLGARGRLGTRGRRAGKRAELSRGRDRESRAAEEGTRAYRRLTKGREGREAWREWPELAQEVIWSYRGGQLRAPKVSVEDLLGTLQHGPLARGAVLRALHLSYRSGGREASSEFLDRLAVMFEVPLSEMGSVVEAMLLWAFGQSTDLWPVETVLAASAAVQGIGVTPEWHSYLVGGGQLKLE